MKFLAVAAPPATTLDKLKAIPLDFWLRFGLAVLGVIALVFFLRKIAKMNKVVLAVMVAGSVTFVGLNWVYEREEPLWATPAVSFLAGFFPSKGPHAKPVAAPPAVPAKKR
ncbi:MAG: hypothetical protein EXS32_00115 [Opitutus sp.]|nr:hypothetical protein [Opitutus sp.]